MNSFYNDLSDVSVWLSECILQLQDVLLGTSLRFRYILYFAFTLLILPFIFDVIFSFILSFRAKKLVIFNPFKPYDFKALSPFSFRSVRSDHFRSDVPKTFTALRGYLAPKEKNILYATVNGRYELKGISSNFSNKLCQSVRYANIYPPKTNYYGLLNSTVYRSDRQQLHTNDIFVEFNKKGSGFPSSKLSYCLFSQRFGSSVFNGRLISVGLARIVPSMSSIGAVESKWKGNMGYYNAARRLDAKRDDKKKEKDNADLP